MQEIQIGGLTRPDDVCNNSPMSNTSAQRTPKTETTITTTKVEAGHYNVQAGSFTFRTVRTTDAYGDYNDEGWHLFETDVDEYGTEEYWNTFPTKAAALESIKVFFAEVRTATVKAEHVGWGSDPLKIVKAYLPRNYTATLEGDTIVIVGTDNAGWTLDGYVIPRLASGMIFATEVN